MLVRSNFFLQVVEKIKELKLSLSKQHKKMLKIRSEMQKIKKKWQNDQAREKFPGKFRENFSNPGNPKNTGTLGISRDSLNFFENFSFSGKL